MTGLAEQPRVLLSAIVVNWNGRDVLRRCLSSLHDHLSHVDHESLVVDNASTDGSPEMVERDFPDVHLIRNAANLGFGAGNNIGMAQARGDFFLLLNSDARLVDDSLLRLVEKLRQRPESGVIGPLLRFEDGRVQTSARRFGSLGTLAIEELGLYRLLPRERVAELLLGGYWPHDAEREVDWITGACMLVRREVFERTGGFDPRIFLYGEELEWCQRIRAAGWSVVFSPEAEVVHIGHESADRLLGPQGRIDRCLLAADRLLRLREGRLAGALAPWLRAAGALLRLLAFGLRAALGKDDDYGRNVRCDSRTVLRHYLRRAVGRVAE